MIVLDANVLIAFLDADDLHHSVAVTLLEDHVTDGFGASALTVAEALVHPTTNDRQDRAAAALGGIGLSVLPVTANDALPLARVRAQYRLRMPDAVVLHAAITTRSGLATFDAALTAAARDAGVDVTAPGS